MCIRYFIVLVIILIGEIILFITGSAFFGIDIGIKLSFLQKIEDSFVSVVKTLYASCCVDQEISNLQSPVFIILIYFYSIAY